MNSKQGYVECLRCDRHTALKYCRVCLDELCNYQDMYGDEEGHKVWVARGRWPYGHNFTQEEES
jgi:hypothetical protein